MRWSSRWLRWPDWWLPVNRADARDALLELWRRAEAERVEVACSGGQGRTGTALACLAVLDGVPAADAVRYVRQHYHPGGRDSVAAAVRREVPVVVTKPRSRPTRPLGRSAYGARSAIHGDAPGPVTGSTAPAASSRSKLAIGGRDDVVSLQLDEDHVGWRIADVVAVVLLRRQPARRAGRNLDISVRVAVVEPSAERAEGVHDAVGMLVSVVLSPGASVYSSTDLVVSKTTL